MHLHSPAVLPVSLAVLLLSLLVATCPAQDIYFPSASSEGRYEGDECSLGGSPSRTGVCRLASRCPVGIGANGERCEFSGNNPVVCCPSSETGNRMTSRIAEQECERFSGQPSTLKDHLSGNRFRVNRGEFPFMALLRFHDEGGSQRRCGASLISRRFLLTAAHCVQNVARANVTLAALTVDDPESDDYEVRNMHIHQGYKRRQNDIALLELDRDVTFESTVGPICLNTQHLDIAPNVNLTVMGWGVDGENTETKHLYKATVAPVATETCAMQFRSVGLNFLSIGDNQLCALGERAGEEYTDACQGDSGGPLVMSVRGRFLLVGVVSTGAQCGSTIPGVYTRVSRYLDWIEKIVWPNY
ncbi:serine protease persephone-like [Anopheles cruzii]|uniref:serine protease persephone-like n=1 Tax=Anopheles cruzii TaxID=68878 RepID=UPI0022EC8089|nr:serine protease persephone-like [Anopheles cruzii]